MTHGVSDSQNRKNTNIILLFQYYLFITDKVLQRTTKIAICIHIKNQETGVEATKQKDSGISVFAERRQGNVAGAK